MRRNYKNSKGERLPGVTTVISSLGWNTEPLLIWANKMGQEGKHHRDVSDAAADVGTIAHAMVEGELKGIDWKELVDMRGITQEQVGLAENAYLSWLEWSRTVNFELKASEQELVCEDLQVGGTIDIAAVKNETSIVDLKTSGPYPEQLIQLAAYGLIYASNYPNNPIKSYYILKLGKEDGSFSYNYWPAGSPLIEAGGQVFKHLREIHKLKNKIKV